MSRIRTLLLLGVTLTAALASGCVSGDSDAGFLATWDLAYVGGGRSDCESAGTETVVLEGRNQRTGVPFRSTFPCRAGAGQTPELAPGWYDVTVSLLDSNNQPISAIAGSFELARRNLTPLDHITFQIQSFLLTWSVVRGNSAISCQQAGAGWVRLVTRLGNATRDVTYDFPCDEFSGFTVAVPVGSYAVSVQLLTERGPNAQVLSSVPAMNFVVGERNRAQLPPITFEVR